MNMDRGRFSLLLLEPGEIYFEDFSAILVPPDTTPKTYDSKKQDGRLKMCSKSLVFDPKDFTKPLIRVPLKDCKVLEQWKGGARFLSSNNVLSVNCVEHIEMLEGNVIAPYKFKGAANFLFLLNYANITDCLPHICQLHRASTLPAAEQADMIAAIVHSRQARVNFDPLWLDLYEKIILEKQADKVTPLAVNPGRVVLSDARIYFQPYNNIENGPVLKIELSSIKSIVKRRFLLQHIGLEIYCMESANSINHIYLALRSPKDREEFYSELIGLPNLKLNKLEQDDITLQWQNGIISNYEYLMYINSLGDRTKNDLTQYPVFPWIICDYKSKTINLNDPKVFRDLSKPVGALNELRLQRLMERYEEMSHPKFIYGSHYSTPGFVLFYLVRLYPHYMLCLQGGRFDHPDRMFNSCADVYKNCLNNMSDFKELIPEFYDTEQQGMFLINDMGINFGYRHDGVKVGDVVLPPWADSPKDFVCKMREALESDIVSKNLHHWIDLIFGYKQKGDEAIKAYNLFYHLCYEGNVDLNSITDLNERHAVEVQIMEFGQIPKQVFKVPHPQRKVSCQLLTEPNQICAEDNTTEDDWKNLTVELHAVFSTHKDAVNSLFVTPDNKRIVSVGHDSKVKVFSLEQNRQIRSVNIGSMPLSSCIQLPDLNVLIIGSWDNQIVLYNMDYGKITDSMFAHDDAVTCMTWGQKSGLLITGSSDCTVKLWEGLNTNSSPRLIDGLRGHFDHNSHVMCLAFDPENEHLAVGTEEGEIYVWNVTEMAFERKFKIHKSSVTAVSYGPDSVTLASCGNDKLIQIMDVNTGMSVFSKLLNSSILCLKWVDSLLLLGCEDGSFVLWDVVHVVPLLDVAAHSGPIKCIELSPNKDFIVTGSEDHNIKLWKKL